MASSDTLVPGMLTQDCRIIFGQTPRGSRPHHDGSPPSPAAVEVRRMRCAQRGPALSTSWRSATQQSAWKLSPDAAEASLRLLDPGQHNCFRQIASKLWAQRWVSSPAPKMRLISLVLVLCILIAMPTDDCCRASAIFRPN